MTDYAVIYGVRRGRVIEPGVSGRRQGNRITPYTTLLLHETGRHFLEEQLAISEDAEGNAWKATIVASHHAPCVRSLPNGSAQSPDDAAYASNLEPLIQNSDLWVHGKLTSFRITRRE